MAPTSIQRHTISWGSVAGRRLRGFGWLAVATTRMAALAARPVHCSSSKRAARRATVRRGTFSPSAMSCARAVVWRRLGRRRRRGWLPGLELGLFVGGSGEAGSLAVVPPRSCFGQVIKVSGRAAQAPVCCTAAVCWSPTTSRWSRSPTGSPSPTRPCGSSCWPRQGRPNADRGRVRTASAAHLTPAESVWARHVGPTIGS